MVTIANKRIPVGTRACVGIVLGAGLLAFALGVGNWEQGEWLRFVCYLIATAAAATLFIQLPGASGRMSVAYVFIVMAVAELGLAEALILGGLAAVVQLFWRQPDHPRWNKVVFDVSTQFLAVTAASTAYESSLGQADHGSLIVRLAVSACTYFVISTISAAAKAAACEGAATIQIWRERYFWSFPFYLLGSTVAALAAVANRYAGWETFLVTLPVAYVVHRSYKLYHDRLESERARAEEVASLHFRTVEALALAISARDEGTRDHVERVQHLARGLGEELGLPAQELEALQTAALLHDIGKLAVPEHILSKPGKLTPGEFDRVKAHPEVGAQILKRVQFPYPVVPIVENHHEKWDGTGYPRGLKGEEIPLGARILAAVDCLDALASDRRYRPALPLEEAMRVVEAESGTSYDPSVVAVLKRRYRELDHQARLRTNGRARLELTPRQPSSAAPQAGYESTCRDARGRASQERRQGSAEAVREACQDVRDLLELSRAVGESISLGETLAIMDSRLHRTIGYDSMAVYLVSGDKLRPAYAGGRDRDLLSRLEIPVGVGLCGWVAESGRSIVNGNPLVENTRGGPAASLTARSALAVPLGGADGIIGVLVLYRKEPDAFRREELRIIRGISSGLEAAIADRASRKIAKMPATTDPLATISDARSLAGIRFETARNRLRVLS